MTIKLDPRPRRPLTSRECCSILSAAIGGAIAGCHLFGTEADVAFILRFYGHLGEGPLSPPSPVSEGAMCTVNGVLGGLVADQHEAAMQAIEWFQGENGHKCLRLLVEQAKGEGSPLSLVYQKLWKA